MDHHLRERMLRATEENYKKLDRRTFGKFFSIAKENKDFLDKILSRFDFEIFSKCSLSKKEMLACLLQSYEHLNHWGYASPDSWLQSASYALMHLDIVEQRHFQNILLNLHDVLLDSDPLGSTIFLYHTIVSYKTIEDKDWLVDLYNKMSALDPINRRKICDRVRGMDQGPFSKSKGNIILSFMLKNINLLDSLSHNKTKILALIAGDDDALVSDSRFRHVGHVLADWCDEHSFVFSKPIASEIKDFLKLEPSIQANTSPEDLLCSWGFFCRDRCGRYISTSTCPKKQWETTFNLFIFSSILSTFAGLATILLLFLRKPVDFIAFIPMAAPYALCLLLLPWTLWKDSHQQSKSFIHHVCDRSPERQAEEASRRSELQRYEWRSRLAYHHWSEERGWAAHHRSGRRF